MYNVTVKHQVFKVEMDAAGSTVDGKPFVADILQFKDGRFHILRNHRSFTAEILQHNEEEKSFLIKVNNSVFTLSVRDKYDDLLREMGIDITAGKKVNDLKAPMPGLVLNVLVSDGQSVAKGDAVLVLEAMKMENILRAEKKGVVAKINAVAGDSLAVDAVIMEFE